MATINNKLIHFKSKSDFNSRYKETTDGGNTYGDFLGTSIVFIQDAKQIWTHGQFYDANETTLASLGIIATATELNYVDGVTSNIQDQLDSKVSSSALNGYLSLSGGTLSKDNLDLNIKKVNGQDAWYIGTWDDSSTPQPDNGSGTLIKFTGNDIAAIHDITSTSNWTTETYLGETYQIINTTDGDVNWSMMFNNYEGLVITLPENKTATINDQEISVEGHTHVASDITALTGYTEGTSTATLTSTMSLNAALASLQNQLNNCLPLSGGTLTGSLFIKESGAGLFYIEQEGIAVKSTNNGNDPVVIMGGGIVLELINSNQFTINSDQILTEANWNEYITVTDTKNTTGTSNSTSKLYLVGGGSQSISGVTTFSNANVYTQNGKLYATQMNATNGFYETSDARLKNFKDDIKALEVVSAIPTKYFTWKKDEEYVALDPQLHIGTSAQEIQKFYPDLVSENGDGHLTVDYARLSIIALAAIKELKSELDELKTRWEGINNPSKEGIWL